LTDCSIWGDVQNPFLWTEFTEFFQFWGGGCGVLNISFTAFRQVETLEKRTLQKS